MVLQDHPCSRYVQRCGSDLCHICLHPKRAHTRAAQEGVDEVLRRRTAQELAKDGFTCEEPPENPPGPIADNE